MADDVKELYGIIEKIAESGKIAKGINEVTKQVEKSNAKAVIVAQDVDPKEIIMHLPILCKEKGIAYLEVPSKAELGKAAKLVVGCSSIAVLDFGGQEEKIKKFMKEDKKE
jgi:large subunit ribosomal protein L7Ae